MKKIKILHVVPGLDAGGISMLLLNYYKKMNLKLFQFDFALASYDSIGMTGKEFEKMGSKIFFLPRRYKTLKGYIEYKKALEKILKENNYDIIHVHQNYLSFMPLRIAKKMKIKVRIAHSHSANNTSELIVKICKLLTKFYATDYFACGIKAGEKLFGKRQLELKKVFILNNCINIKKFEFDEKKRKEIRDKMGWNDSFIIGNVGRLANEKNQKFLIDIFKKICTNNEKVFLIIIGNGELENELKSYVKLLELDKKVIFLGRRNDINELLQGFDVFVLSSLSEGLPVSGVEAIASSIPCVFSDNITKELDLRENIKYISLNEKDKWIKTILHYKNFKRKENSIEVIKPIFDINKNAKQLEEKYKKLLED